MKKILFVVVLGIWAAWQFKPGLFTFDNKAAAFDEQGNALTLVFTHPQCKKPCSDVLSLLKKRGISYKEYIQDGTEENRKMWKQFSGSNMYPYVVIGDEHVLRGRYYVVSRLAMAYGDTVLTSTERYYMKKHFYEDGRAKLVMYGTAWCPYCKKLRTELNKRDIDFADIDVEKSIRGKSMIQTLGIAGYPTMYYGYQRLQSIKPKDVLAMF